MVLHVNIDFVFRKGADGSIFIFQDVEVGFHANTGIDDAIDIESPFIAAHNGSIGVADLYENRSFAAVFNLINFPAFNLLLQSA